MARIIRPNKISINRNTAAFNFFIIVTLHTYSIVSRPRLEVYLIELYKSSYGLSLPWAYQSLSFSIFSFVPKSPFTLTTLIPFPFLFSIYFSTVNPSFVDHCRIRLIGISAQTKTLGNLFSFIRNNKL